MQLAPVHIHSEIPGISGNNKCGGGGVIIVNIDDKCTNFTTWHDQYLKN